MLTRNIMFGVSLGPTNSLCEWGYDQYSGHDQKEMCL